MKYIIILADGMADEPIEALGNKSPLQFAETPYLDKLAQMGQSGMLDTIPEGFEPGSEIANLSVLGYDVAKVFEGRGSLEAASIGVEINPGEMAMRCNLICLENGIIKNHSAGHLSNEEGHELIAYLNEHLANDIINFYPGVSYRHLLKMKNGVKDVIAAPPHDFRGVPFADILIKAKNEMAKDTADQLNDFILRSQELLENHPINQKRRAEGKDPANSIWPWSAGYKPKMEKISELYPIKSGAVISAVDLINGIGKYAGLEVIEVEGVTGLYDTNYEGKAQAAINALREKDFVFLHIEASDEAGHEGDVDLKVRTIEYLDRRIVKPIFEELVTWNEPVAIAVLPDHPTPCRLKTHSADPIPFVIYKSNGKSDNVQVYDEFAAQKGAYGWLKGNEFMKVMFE